ncbi:condensation domain-containing protein, partial [Photobacterium sp. DNB22_13_2]
PEWVNAAQYVAPRNAQEQQLCTLWQDVLGLERVGIEDNFFTIGGDSIISLALLFKMKQSGFSVSPQDIQRYPTVELLVESLRLASVENKRSAMRKRYTLSQSEPVTGDVPLTPIIHWLLRRGEEITHWNVYELWTVDSEKISAEDVAAAYAALTLQHDILRQRLFLDGEHYRQTIVDPETFLHDNPVVVMDLGESVTDMDLVGILREKLATIDLAQAPIKIYYLRLPGNEARIFYLLHHIIFDGYSRYLLQQDFMDFLQQRLNGEPMRYPYKTGSVKEWAEALTVFANQLSGHEREYWLTLPWQNYKPMPRHYAAGANDIAHTLMLEQVISVELSQVLLTRLKTFSAIPENHIHIACIALAYRDWSGHDVFVTENAMSARSLPYIDLDLSRTVGWLLDPSYIVIDLASLPEDNWQAIEQIHQQICAAPYGGMAYGALRYMHEDLQLRQAMSRLPHPEFLFNYQVSLQRGSDLSPQPLLPVAQQLVNSREDLSPATGGSATSKMYEHPDLDRNVLIYAEATVNEEQCIVGRFQINTNIHKVQQVEPFLSAYTRRLSALAEYIVGCE